MELLFCNCLAMCSARCRLHMASLLSPSHSVTHVDPVVLALLRSSSFEVHVSAEGGSAPLCPTLNPYLPIKGVMGCKSGTLERPTTGDPTNRMLPSPPCYCRQRVHTHIHDQDSRLATGLALGLTCGSASGPAHACRLAGSAGDES